MEGTSRQEPPAGPRHGPHVLFVSDVQLYREALGLGLGGIRDIVFAGHCGGGEACAWLETAAIDVVLLDTSLPAALALARQIRRRFPAVKVLALALDLDPDRVLDCAEAGFSGYLDQDVGIEGLVAAVHQSVRGEVACSPRIGGLLFERVALLAGRLDAAPPPVPVRAAAEGSPGLLTARETEIAALIDAGLTNKEIALKLRISAATVKNHIHNILDKLEVPRRTAIRGRLGRGPVSQPREDSAARP